MRAELIFALEKPVMCLDYRRIVLSWLKQCLTNCNQGKYFDRYYQGTVQKNYAFTVIMQKPQFTKDRIYLEEPSIKILFSAYDDRLQTGLVFFSAFLGMKNKKFPLPEGNVMTLKTVRRMNEVLITESTVYFQTCLGNGLCIREHNRETNRDRFVTSEDVDFREKALAILKTQAKLAGYPEHMLETMDIEPIRCKKVVVFFYKRYVDTTVGIFRMKGEPSVLQFFLCGGDGLKTRGRLWNDECT